LPPLKYLILAVVPATLAVHYLMPERQTLSFVLACASMIPLARLLSDATEQLANRTGPTLGALLNVSFGNAGELVIGFFAMRQGLQSVVKASITGSILVNLLLSLGISMIVGGVRKKTLTFNPLRARTLSTMLLLAAIALIFPAAYHYLVGPHFPARESDLSFEFAIVLLITYALSLLFTLRTHHDLLTAQNAQEVHAENPWSTTLASSMLALSAALVAWIGEILVGALEPAARMFGFSNFFVGLVVVAVAGNAAEGTSAIRAALRNRMDLVLGIAAGSSIQIALFVAPALVIASHWIAPRPVDFVFTPVELLAVVMAIAITTQVAGDGDSNWFEGVQLVVVYLLIAAMVYWLPPQPFQPGR